MNTNLIVVRHGETEWNLGRRWQGHDDSPLTENGHEQAKAAAKAVQNLKADFIYSSDLGRAMQTAQYLSESTQLPIKSDSRLRERKLGVFEGLTTAQIEENYPGEYQHFKNLNPKYVVPGGESIQEKIDRSLDCFNEIATNHASQTILVVTHGGILDGLFRSVVGIPIHAPRRFKIWNCSLSFFTHNSEGWRLDSFSDISHLRFLPTIDDIR